MTMSRRRICKAPFFIGKCPDFDQRTERLGSAWGKGQQSEIQALVKHSRREKMNRLSLGIIVGIFLLLPAAVPAQVAGSSVIGVAAAELRDVTLGWSAKQQVLGKAVYNDKNESIGHIDDIIIAPDKSVSYAIIGVGGFLGVDRHDVAIPVAQLKLKAGKFVLPGASKEALEAAPKFEYAPPSK
ncbi:MAG: PRC-barrel domain-containing protein [Steroidobacteraceae bacterium]